MKKQYAVISCIVSGAILFYAAMEKPRSNWDLIAYMAVVANYEISEPDVLHRYVYEQLEQGVSLESYSELVAGGFRNSASQNPVVLMQQLPFYKVRVLYCSCIYLLSEIGIGTIGAIHLISAFSTTLGLMVLCLTFKPYLNGTLLFMLPVCGLLLGAYDTARYSSPDGMAFLFLSLSVCALMNRHWAIFILLPLSVLVRTDLLVFAIIVLFYIYLSECDKKVYAIISAISTIVVYIALNRYSGNYGWSRLICETFINRTNFPADSTAELTFSKYMTVLFRNTHQFLDKQFLTYLGLVIVVIYLYFRKYSFKLFLKITEPGNIPLAVTMISFVYIAVHFVFFPAIWHRFFSGFYLLGLISFFLVISENQYNIAPGFMKHLTFRQEYSNE